MYKSPKMTGSTSFLGDIYNPNLHRLNVTLRALAGKIPEFSAVTFIRKVNDDIKRLIKMKHSKSPKARNIAAVAMDAYTPLLVKLMSYLDDLMPEEDYFAYMQRKGVNWGRIRSTNLKGEAKARRMYTDIRCHISCSKEDLLPLVTDFKEVYIYVGRLYAIFDIASYPRYFQFIPENTLEDIRAAVSNIKSYTKEDIDHLFDILNHDLNCYSTYELKCKLGKHEEQTHFFS